LQLEYNWNRISRQVFPTAALSTVLETVVTRSEYKTTAEVSHLNIQGTWLSNRNSVLEFISILTLSKLEFRIQLDEII